MERVILHSDLNSFFASVECMLNPELKGKPMAVVGDQELRHGIVLAKSEEAKKCGVKTGDVLWEAKQKCPDIIFVKTNHKKYEEVSQQVREIYYRYTPQVEPFGIDECFLDCTGCAKSGQEIADEIRQVLIDEIGITASVGVSFNKIFAKLGSDIKKPNATTVINRQNYKDIIFNLPTSDIMGVGRKTAKLLAKCNINTLGDIAVQTKEFMKSMLGKCGEDLWKNVNGLNEEPVQYLDYLTDVKSVGNSSTAYRDLVTLTDIKRMLNSLADSVATRLRALKFKGNIVHLSVRDNNLKWWGKQAKTSYPICTALEITEQALKLFHYYDFTKPVHSIGVSVSGLVTNAVEQLTLFEDHSKKERIEKAIDQIRKKHGDDSIKSCKEINNEISED
ncbi:MAG: DNA polymerase IV [Firmicutes bacterium]|nr:DNA polymerase IV [Bacillota bacterium]